MRVEGSEKRIKGKEERIVVKEMWKKIDKKRRECVKLSQRRRVAKRKGRYTKES